MKETDTSCEFAISLKSAPGVQEMINTNEITLLRSQIICQLLLPPFSDCETLPNNFVDESKKTFLKPNGIKNTYLDDVGCFGKSSKHCPHPDSPHKISQREEYQQMRSKALKDYKPMEAKYGKNQTTTT